MSEDGVNKPTSGKPIFVGSDPNLEGVVRALLTAIERFLDEDGAMVEAPYEGELSGWIAELASKPNDVSLFHSQTLKPSVERQAIRESAAAMTDPRSAAEAELVRSVIDGISTSDSARITDTLESGDRPEIEQLRGELKSKLEPAIGEITRDRVVAMMEQLKRFRALRAALLCMILYKTHPMLIISNAKKGDRRAVLDLLKVDKLFATDSCTCQVLRNAALRADRPFMRQIAASINAKPKMGPKRICRLYIYLLCAFNMTPQLTELQLRLGRMGEEFRTVKAFERFAERCRADFLEMTAPAPTEVALG